MGKASGLCFSFLVESLTSRVRTLRENIDTVLNEEPDGIHDMRVASRRLRAALSECAPLLPKGPRNELRRIARRVTRLLGRARELDVTLEMLAQFSAIHADAREAAAALARPLREERARLSPDCIEAAHLAACEDLDALLVRLFEGAHPRAGRVLEIVSRRLKRRFEALFRCYEKWMETGDREQLHRVRVAFKKLRYACELFAPFFDDNLHGCIQELRQLQEHLGAWNDARALLREAAASVSGENGPPPGMDTVCLAFEEQLRAHLQAFHTIASDFFSSRRRRQLRRLMSAAHLPPPE
ncbi:MAG: CHAD domain-containing protein [Candidatus Hydrogenedentes bacterium]|nr:CHAD domain-containing protein [Candidatus Hydrogenedentota bacterium]